MSLSRPTLALAMIIKNEAHNLSKLLQSVRGCFDEIHITDTGSTDSSIEFLEKINEHVKSGNPEWSGIPEIKIHHFIWVDDFAKARNYSFSHPTTDFIMWLDGDDVLSDAAKFIHWRNNVMHAADYWCAEYLYHFDVNGKPDCQFLRERVVRNKIGFKWKYFVHEGIVNEERSDFWQAKVSTWEVHHLRTLKDLEDDKGRNTSIFDKHMDSYDSWHPRMYFYLGKELFENQKIKEAGKHLLKAIKSKDLEYHDRILSVQYCAQSAAHAEAYDQFFNIIFEGLKEFPNRAELHCVLADTYLKLNKVHEALIHYKHALNCDADRKNGVVLVFNTAYKFHPLCRIVEIYLNSGNYKTALEYIDKLRSFGFTEMSDEYEKKANSIKSLTQPRKSQSKVRDVVFTTAPQLFVTGWNENNYAQKGWGGSETAIIQTAKHMARKLDRKIKIFSPVECYEVMPSGVEMIPHNELNGYIKNVEPAVHIAWRHTGKLSAGAKTYVWCHDLVIPGLHDQSQYDHVISLSDFHKNYLHEIQGVPLNKIIVSKNGIDPEIYRDDIKQAFKKDPFKIIWPNSPDRGLEQAIAVVKRAREKSGFPLELHVFYGFDNMLKGPLKQKAMDLQLQCQNHDWIFNKGNVTKTVLRNEMMESAVWLYTGNFIETFCITAWEAVCSSTYPIVRRMGALKDTLKDFEAQNFCEIIERGIFDESDVDFWADRVIDAVQNKKWEKIKVDPQLYGWERVSDHFIEFMDL